MKWIYKLITSGIPYEWSKRGNNKKITKCGAVQYEITVVHDKDLVLRYKIFESVLYDFIKNEFNNETFFENGAVSIEQNLNVKH